MTTRVLPAKIPGTYEELASLLIPRPIHDDIDLTNATEMIDWLAGHELNADQEDYLEAISHFVEAYEESLYPIHSRMKPLQALKYLLKENGMSGSDLGRLLGKHRTLGSAILRGDRQLSKSHIKTLARQFSVDAGLFLR